MSMDAFWIILTGTLVAGSCALPGSFLMLRKMTMVGDAISHAVLPGIVIAFLISGSINSIPMMIGAALFGVLVTVIIEFLSKKSHMQEDAAIGVSFTALFALGVILISSMAGMVDLDQDCVLYGEIQYVPLDIWEWNGMEMGPIATTLLSINFLLVLLFTLIGFKGLKLTSFDPVYAATVGISVSFWQYALMGIVSLTTVFSFEYVGAIMVVAFLVGPSAVAYLLTDKLSHMLWIAVGVGFLSSFTGYYLGVWLDASISGAMSSVIGIFFMLAFFFSPKHGFFRQLKMKNG
ncbi:metal ABC transporter permease [Algivirga pacifica]|uniref:Metal ABC transporter permease n=1 Tax=Algivirga pacifica TaxID=1162670 RepID=A0ABP9DAY6_9BACT